MEIMSNEAMLAQALAQQKPEPAPAEPAPASAPEQKKVAPVERSPMVKIAEAIKTYVAKSFKSRDAEISLLKAAVADRDHQLDRHANHLMRISTKLSAMETRMQALERKAQP